MVLPGVCAAYVFFLVSFKYFIVSEAVHCRTCYTSPVSVTNVSNVPLTTATLLHRPSCYIANSRGGSPCYSWIGQGAGVGVAFNFTGGGHDDIANVITLAACFVHAVELKQAGFKPAFYNYSGILSVCVNYTDYITHIKNFTHHQALALHPRHILSPAAIRWGSVIALCLAVLLAV
uniref:GP4 n=1 Tax=Bamboo rat arterivirus TaxID=3038165 RepID=A0AAT9TXR1_9NIDO|nr:GP4 [Bamboo rat arterivirus]WFD49975.1 GP4 [Bamboo rat arterivirus]WFG83239.1 GP4 [Arteriviridae sp.]WFG95399.1 GP4 [Arteriviridae sp.]